MGSWRNTCSKTLREENENGWNRERKSGKSSSIKIAQDIVSWKWGEGSIYTWRGKPTSLGLMPSVHYWNNVTGKSILIIIDILFIGLIPIVD